MLSPPKWLTLSSKVYSLLLHLYPAPFRREYGYHMAQLFRDDVRGTMQEGGTWAVLGLWLLALQDLLHTAVAEHLWEVFHMPIEKLSRWSGLAAVLGGALFVYMMVYEVPVDDNRLLWTLLPMVCLWIVALASLFRRLPAASSPGSKTTFAVAMIGLLLLLAGLFSFYTAGPDLPWYLLGIGFYGLAIGIVGMGIIALIQRVLGPWRFVPLLLGGVLLGFMVTATVPSSPEALYQVFIVLNGISWLLLGIALWSTHREPQDPGLLA